MGDMDGIGDVDDLDRILYRSALVTVGAFRARPDHPRFADSGPIERTIFVFPRTRVIIRHEGRAPFATDTSVVTYYNRGQRYVRRAVDPRGDACEWFSVREDALRETVARRDPGTVEPGRRVFECDHGPSDPGAYLLQRQVVRHLEVGGEPDRLAVEEGVMRVLERVVALLPGGRGGGGAASTSPATVAESVRELLGDAFRRPLTLDDIAAAVGASASHLCREFRAWTGTTIHRYRDQLRLRRALELVADGGAADLSRVAHHLGYSSHSHFTASFRRAFGVTPSEFRRTASGRAVRELASQVDARDPGAAWRRGR